MELLNEAQPIQDILQLKISCWKQTNRPMRR